MVASESLRTSRLQDFDYGQPGLYFVTICTHNRVPWFGEVDPSGMILLANRAVLDEVKRKGKRPASMPNLLFVCSRNRKRSPTAEVVLRDWPGVKTLSAGTAPDAETPLDADLVEWADIVFAMEGRHRKVLQSRFGTLLRDKKVVCLQIPDDYEFMDPALVERLKEIVPRWLPG